ncbi:MAG: Dehydrogenases with different specificities (related to short-chain alcohol dehydrogenases) [uncultured Paraburkholderia sp.]|nr:MAG: Dehydrogenases with different specificities (related to short-chain alcohol dehydrogenases) [uncultured Paraburkholderia sp.]CAH2787906.1 MAG: Dehydrogenases with different specificities (related to short-chain alcohol dehydrogenases) [uncultured Paraburkholderia sp.]CAH2921517.1 MAG: Dehydrogenases with different specificities (related to short-chain alcohol dehydrogenases) [uncultured Paraburkholderia sp.]CAH2922530.1 MAG: Dehydrogenases with different specificities (related to short-c
MKTVLIVGASRGIGQEFVRQYKESGWRVLATAREGAALDALAQLGAQPYSVDVTEPADIAALGWKLDGEHVDVAIVVSGVYGPRSEGIETITAEDFDHVMHTNVRGPMQLMPILLPLVEETGGVLAVISSKMGSIADPSGTSGWLYRVSKAALNDALKLASLEAQRATCVSLHPGWVQTDMGGAQAAVHPTRSVTGMREVLAQAAASREAFNGRFYQYDGTQLDW